MPTIDVENAWGLDATSFGNHEFDYGSTRILKHAGAGRTSRACRRTSSRRRPAASRPGSKPSDGLPRQRRAGRRDRRDGQEHAGAGRRGQHRGPAVPRRGASGSSASPATLRAQGVEVQVVVIHEGATAGANADRRTPPVAVDGPDHADRRQAAGHDRRPRDRRPHAPRGEHGRRRHPGGRGLQRRRQLLRRPADGQRRRRRLGGRGDAHRQEPRRRPAARREGDRRQGQRRHRAAAQRGDRRRRRSTCCATTRPA